MKKWILTCLLFNLLGIGLHAQNVCTIDASAVAPIQTTELPMAGKSPDGTTLSANNKYFIKNGKPWFPVMGEFHYNRYPSRYWEEEIIKMKMAGLSIVATYVFWNAHENPKGVWNWKNDLDLREFLTLCKKHHMYVWLRVGPWSHGEQLYGGFPEWIQAMPGKRTNDPSYLAESKKLFAQIGQQTKDLFFEEGGPIIGTQLENEYASGQADHISTLKQMALDAQIKPVFFTVTANTVFHDDRLEVIPLQGSYPYRGWEKGGGGATMDFLYGNDQWIMEASLGKVFYDVTKYPRGLCEQGCGSQQTYNNRFIVEPEVVEAHLQNQVGRGMNLIGYYMFHGGTQMPGLKEPGLPESYDFQAPLSEFGYERLSYCYLKLLHHFINDYGQSLAPMQVVEPQHAVTNPLNTDSLRYVVRTNGKEGFVFLCNTQVRVTMPDKKTNLSVKLKDETIEYPSFLLKGQTSPVLPFNTIFQGGLIKYALVQPLARFTNDGQDYLFYTQLPGVSASIAIAGDDITSVYAKGWAVQKHGNLTVYEMKDNNTIQVVNSAGVKTNIIVLSRSQSERAWRTTFRGKEMLLISNADVDVTNDKIVLRSQNEKIMLSVYPGSTNDLTINNVKSKPVIKGLSADYVYALPAKTIDLPVHRNNGEVSFSVPSALPVNVSDIFLTIKYLGGSAELLDNGAVLTDDLYNGTDWKIGLKRYAGKRLSIKVKSWNKNITGVNAELVKKVSTSAPSIASVEVKAEYSVEVK